VDFYFVNILSSYVYDKLNAKKGDYISIDVTVDNGKKSSKRVKFKGKVENLEKALSAIRKYDE